MHLRLASSINKRQSHLLATLAAFNLLSAICLTGIESTSLKRHSACTKLQLKCPQDSIIQILSASFIVPKSDSPEEEFCKNKGLHEVTETYQNDSPEFAPFVNECVPETDVTQVVTNKCQKEANTCDFDFTNWSFPSTNGCESSIRMMRVNYTCLEVIHKQSFCEGDEFAISCDEGEQLVLINATFRDAKLDSGLTCGAIDLQKMAAAPDAFGFHDESSKWYLYTFCGAIDATKTLASHCSNGCKFISGKKMFPMETIVEKCNKVDEFDKFITVPLFTFNRLFLEYKCQTATTRPLTTHAEQSTRREDLTTASESIEKATTATSMEPKKLQPKSTAKPSGHPIPPYNLTTDVTSKPVVTESKNSTLPPTPEDARTSPKVGHDNRMNNVSLGLVSAWNFVSEHVNELIVVVVAVAIISLLCAFVAVIVGTYHRGKILITDGASSKSGVENRKNTPQLVDASRLWADSRDFDI